MSSSAIFTKCVSLGSQHSVRLASHQAMRLLEVWSHAVPKCLRQASVMPWHSHEIQKPELITFVPVANRQERGILQNQMTGGFRRQISP